MSNFAVKWQIIFTSIIWPSDCKNWKKTKLKITCFCKPKTKLKTAVFLQNHTVNWTAQQYCYHSSLLDAFSHQIHQASTS